MKAVITRLYFLNLVHDISARYNFSENGIAPALGALVAVVEGRVVHGIDEELCRR